MSDSTPGPDYGDDLSISTAGCQSGGGTWVRGTLAGHRFQALVFAAHAECASDELGDSRISKLWVQRLADRRVVANFDRGWDVRPADAAAARVVGFLAAGLADHVFG
jgi:hypothetical protein